MRAWAYFIAVASLHDVTATDSQRVFLASPQPNQDGALSLNDAISKATQSQLSTPSQRGATVKLLPGVYELDAPLNFASDDGSSFPFSSSSPLRIQSADDTNVAVLSGGVEIANWTVGAEPWQWVATLPDTVSAVNISSLWVDGSRRPVARTETFQYIDSTVDSVFVPLGALPDNLEVVQGLQAIIYHCWTASYHGISSISQNSSMVTASLINQQSINFNSNVKATGKRVYFQGHPEFLSNGSATFYVDIKARSVTYAPSADELAAYPNGPADFVAVAPQLVELVRVDGEAASGVVLQNLSFAYAAADFSTCLSGTCDAQSASFLTSAALHFEGARDVQLKNLNVSHVDGYAVWVGNGSRNVVMDRLHIFDVGTGGVRIGPPIGGVSGASRADNVSLTNSVLEDGGTRITQ